MDKNTLDAFCEFAKYADYNLFVEIFGKRLGEHFWWKHEGSHRRNMTWTYNDMDNSNRDKIIQYLTKRELVER
jgi:hypothetical protein